MSVLVKLILYVVAMSIYIIVSNSICIFVSRGSSSVNMFLSSTISLSKQVTVVQYIEITNNVNMQLVIIIIAYPVLYDGGICS